MNLATTTSNISNVSAYTTLYDALKTVYPGAQDSLVNYAPPAPPAPAPTSNVISE